LPRIPDKQFFKIGEVSRITELKPHVLRYWESEFKVIRPQKSRTNQRLYKRADVELLLYIKKLLHQDGYTIAGANKHLDELRRRKKPPLNDPIAVLEHLRGEVKEILQLLEEDDGLG
jgi:DNA-binding transcriptional MerR regulator